MLTSSFKHYMRTFIIVLVLILLSIHVFAPSDPYWYDTSWHFRTNLTINNTNYDRSFWPIEFNINFTNLINQANRNGTFDSASIRVIEQNSSDYVLFEHPYQFENIIGFDSVTNAAGILIFVLNGTTSANQIRYINVYFDILENGVKTPVTYPSTIDYSWDGEEASVNNSDFKWKIDTLRGENTSGLYDARNLNILFVTLSETSKTKEYSQYSNGTHIFSFDLRNNATFIPGPMKLIIEQKGAETLWNNPDAITGEGYLTKRYIFYDNVSWFKIEQNFTNIGASQITRNSTSAGAVSINDISTAEFLNFPTWFGNESEPYSWYGASDFGSRGMGLINLNSSSNANYSIKYDSSSDRMGSNLDLVTLNPGESIIHTTVMQFDDLEYNQEILESLRDQFFYSPVINLGITQFIPVNFDPKTNYTVYNRNATVLIIVNITSDPFSMISKMNATVDMGTVGTSDDIYFDMYDDGDALHGDDVAFDRIFSNWFNLSELSELGTWNVSVNAYDLNDIFLKTINTQFNVTDAYNVTLLIFNPSGLVNRIINATIDVKNILNEFVIGATINCTYGAGDLSNITDYNNGTYFLNFTAPALTDIYDLNCTASKFNNTGQDSQIFETETSETIMSLVLSEQNYTSSNISLLLGDSFDFSINTTDIGGANAKYVNISLSLPPVFNANSTFESCGNVSMLASCFKSFNINIINGTVFGNYTINVSTSWLNPSMFTNSTNVSFITYVLSNPILNTTSEPLSGIVADGKTVPFGDFTVYSIGNDNLVNTTFNVSGLPDFTFTFNPSNISVLASGLEQIISVNISIPLDYNTGDYLGTINISSVNGGWKTIDLDVEIVSKTEISLQKSSENYTTQIISLATNDSFNIDVDAENIGLADSKDMNLTLSMPTKLISNSTFEMCGRLNISDICTRTFEITVSNNTNIGNYTFNITATWLNPDMTLNSTLTSFTVYVLTNPILNVSGFVSTALPDNSSILAGNFTLYSIGNDNVTNMTFNVSGLSNFIITFNPINVSFIDVNDSEIVFVNVTVPFGMLPGVYSGVINISSSDGGNVSVDINITVLIRREWYITPEFCGRSENPDFGTVCFVDIVNTGNAPINFTINTIYNNYTWTNETNMTVLQNSSYPVEFFYNITDVPKAFYYENYTFNTTNLDAIPLYSQFNITMIPYIMPLFSFNFSENNTEQGDVLGFYINVTDRSMTGINWTYLNITRPNGTIETFNMSLLSLNGSVSSWFFNYSGSMSDYVNYSANESNYTGSTNDRGIYNATIYSQDNTGVIGTFGTSFTVFTKLLIGFTAGSTKYYQGSTGSIYYTLTDVLGNGLPDANVTITLKDPLGNLVYTDIFVTGSTGQILPIPTFTLTNDANTGFYNLTADMVFYDSVFNETLVYYDNMSFNLQAGSTGGGGGLTADVDTAVVWYPDNIMRFELWFSYAGNVTEPDNITLLVYNPADQLYINITKEDLNNTSAGLYHYKYAMPINTASGYYRAVLTATKDGFVSQKVKPFRVAKGGPYDVRVMIIPPYEVPLMDYVNFEIYIENMGEVTQDVYLDYWVSSGNETYYYNSEAVLTPVGVNVTILRNAYIFSNQILGLTTLTVKATYDNVQAPIISTDTFNVIDESFVIPPPPVIPPYTPPASRRPTNPDDSDVYPSEELVGEIFEIDIENYNHEINIVRGWTDISGVRVKNTGVDVLHNITLQLSGIASSWFKITPDIYEEMPSENSTLFIIELIIPGDALPGIYPFTLTATSKESSIDKTGRIVIFTSIEDLIKEDIMNLKIELDKLEADARFSERIGKNISSIWDLFDQVKSQLVLAEDNLNKKSFDEALQNIQIVSGLLKRIRTILEYSSKFIDVDDSESIWIMGLKALIVLFIIASISVWWMRNHQKLKLKPLNYYLKKPLNKLDIDEKKRDFAERKIKTERVLKLLEIEFEEGIIGSNAYDELKKLNEGKLKDFEYKLQKLK